MGLQIFLIIAVSAFAIGSILLARSTARNRGAMLAGWAAARQFYFHPGKVRGFDDEHPVLRCLRRGDRRYADNIANGKWGGFVFTSFDYHCTTGSGKSRKEHHFSAILLRPNFPLQPLIVRPEGFFDKVKAGFGINDIDFESAEFSKKFFVTAVDKRWAYDVITPRTMEFLLHAQGAPTRFSFELDHELICVISDKLLEIPEIDSAYHFGKTVLDELPDYVRQQAH